MDDYCKHINRHIAINEEERGTQFCCPICEQGVRLSFNGVGALRTHMTKVHPQFLKPRNSRENESNTSKNMKLPNTNEPSNNTSLDCTAFNFPELEEESDISYDFQENEEASSKPNERNFVQNGKLPMNFRLYMLLLLKSNQIIKNPSENQEMNQKSGLDWSFFFVCG